MVFRAVLYVIIMSRTLLKVNLHSIVTSDIAPVVSKEFLDIQTNIECRFTLKRELDEIIMYSQMHFTDICLQHSSIIRPVWLNG